MKKRGFTLVEVVVAFAIFLAVIIPINNLTRGLTRLMGRDALKEERSIGSTGGLANNLNIQNYLNNMATDLAKQAEWGGYKFLNESVKSKAALDGQRNYTITKSGQKYILKYTAANANKSEQDYLTLDPYQSNQSLNGVKEYTFPVDDVYGGTVNLKIKKGKIKNLRALKAADIPDVVSASAQDQEFIFGEIKITLNTKKGNTTTSMNAVSYFVVTPMQDPCHEFKNDSQGFGQ